LPPTYKLNYLGYSVNSYPSICRVVGYVLLVTESQIISMLNYNLFYSWLKMAFLGHQKPKNNIPNRYCSSGYFYE
ncbi:hypothetical protein, partial [Providencia huaxiensis]